MKRVIIESPYAGKKLNLPLPIKWLSWIIYKITTYQNVLYARKCLKDSLRRGEAPFASHLLYTQVLDDRNWIERENGICAALNLTEDFDLVAVYIDNGISKGMREGIAERERLGIKIEYRRLNK